MPRPATVLYGFFCEDIRLEADSRVSAIGLLGSSFQLPAPGLLRSLAFHAHIYNPDSVAYPFRVRVEIPGMTSPFEQVSQLAPNPAGGASTGHNLNIAFGSIPLRASGTIQAQISVDCAPPSEFIATISVTIAEAIDPR